MFYDGNGRRISREAVAERSLDNLDYTLVKRIRFIKYFGFAKELEEDISKFKAIYDVFDADIASILPDQVRFHILLISCSN